MSTRFYLECLNHEPPLRAEAESGQHYYDLPQIRADIANRAQLVALNWEAQDSLPYFSRRTVWFLNDHPKCRIGIIDEYGRTHPIVEEGPS